MAKKDADLIMRLHGVAKRLKEVSDIVNDDESDIGIVKEGVVRVISEVDYLVKIFVKHLLNN